MRLIPSLLFLLPLLVLVATARGHEGHSAALAPVSVEIDLSGSAGGPVDVRYHVTAEHDLRSLTAEVLLVHGGQILDQRPLVAGAVATGEVLESGARVMVPDDGRRHQVEVVVRAVTEGPGEGVAFSAGVLESLGDGALPSTAERTTTDGVERRLVPARRTPGMAAASEGAPLVVGRMLYEDREESFTGWTGQWPLLPVRHARVELVDDLTGDVLATGATAPDGSYALPLPGNGTGDLVVHCDAISDLAGSPLTAADVGLTPYRVSSAVQSGWDLSRGLDLGDTVALRVKSGQKYGNPFGQLDQLVRSAEYLMHLGETDFQDGIWSLWPGGTQSMASTPYVYLSTDDGYDDSVVLHEVGHVIADFFSEDDHSGGSHVFGDSDQGPTLSLGEGYATFFGCAVKQHAGLDEPGEYLDLRGNLGSGLGTVGLRLRLETGAPWAATAGGEADEVAVACALWNWIDTSATLDGDGVDDDPLDGSWTFPGGIDADAALWGAYTGPTVLAAEGVTVVDLWNGLFVDGFASEPSTLAACFEEWKIRVRPDAYEPDDSATEALALPLGQWSIGHTLYRGDASHHPVPGDGDEDWYRFDSVGFERFAVETRYPAGKADAETYVDPWLEVRGPDGEILDVDSNSGYGRNALIEFAALEPGTYTARVFTADPQRRTGSYELKVEFLGTVDPPTITSTTPSSMPVVDDAGSSGIVLTGSGLSGVTSVTFDGQPIPAFFAFSDDQLSFTAPVASKLGPVEIVLSGPTGTAQTSVEVTPVSEPTLLAGNGTLFWSFSSIVLRAAATPGHAQFVVMAGQQGPTPFGGLVTFDVGAGAVIPLWTVPITASGGASIEFPLPPSLTGGIDVFLQSTAVGPGSSFPLPVSNVEPGKIF